MLRVVRRPCGAVQIRGRTAVRLRAARQLHLHGRFCDEQLPTGRREQAEICAVPDTAESDPRQYPETDKVYKGAGEKSTGQRAEQG